MKLKFLFLPKMSTLQRIHVCTQFSTLERTDVSMRTSNQKRTDSRFRNFICDRIDLVKELICLVHKLFYEDRNITCTSTSAMKASRGSSLSLAFPAECPGLPGAGWYAMLFSSSSLSSSKYLTKKVKMC